MAGHNLSPAGASYSSWGKHLGRTPNNSMEPTRPAERQGLARDKSSAGRAAPPQGCSANFEAV